VHCIITHVLVACTTPGFSQPAVCVIREADLWVGGFSCRKPRVPRFQFGVSGSKNRFRKSEIFFLRIRSLGVSLRVVSSQQ
jgi:hypothetical protein